MIFQLCELDSVKKFARDYKYKYRSLDILINNAGHGPEPGARTKNGYEFGFYCMHIGHAQLIKELTPALIASKSKQARIVNVASNAGIGAMQVEWTIDTLLRPSTPKEWSDYWDEQTVNWGGFHPVFYKNDKGEGDLRGEYVDGGYASYSRAKEANILYSISLQRDINKNPKKYGGENKIIINSLHTGGVDTGGFQTLEMPHWILNPAHTIAQKFIHIFWRTPHQGSMPTLYAALSNNEQITKGGNYIDAMCIIKYEEFLEYMDNKTSNRLFEVTQQLLL